MLQEMMETPEKWGSFVRLSKRLYSFDEEALSKLRLEIIRKWKALNVEKWRVHFYSERFICFQIGYDDNGVNIILSFDPECGYDFMVTTDSGISKKNSYSGSEKILKKQKK